MDSLNKNKRKRELENIENISLNEETIKKIVEEAPNIEALDETGVKKMILQLEKKINQNQLLRLKFPDKPEKFMSSEVDLYEQIKVLESLSTAPNLYPIIVNLGVIPSLLSLLSHENTDIASAVLDVFIELIDPDIFEEDKSSLILLESMIKNEALQLIVACINRMDFYQNEENASIYKALQILEQWIEIQPEISIKLTENTNIFEFLIKTLQPNIPVDETKMYCAEILSILLSNPENQKRFGNLTLKNNESSSIHKNENENENENELKNENAIDLLLQAIAAYKKHSASSAGESELVENLFDSLCYCLQISENKNYFAKAQGIELMLKILKSKVKHSPTCLKVLDFALQNHSDNCILFVRVLGLKTIFATFMNKLKPKISEKHKRSFSDEEEEHILSIIISLFQHLTDSYLERLLNKFEENNFEKIERLLELHDKYKMKVTDFNIKIEEQKKEILQHGGTITEEDEEEFYLEKLDNGLFTLQLVDRIIAQIINNDRKQIKEYLKQLLSQKDKNKEEIIITLKEYVNNIEKEGEEKNHLLYLIQNFIETI